MLRRIISACFCPIVAVFCDMTRIAAQHDECVTAAAGLPSHLAIGHAPTRDQ
jgi:hypothetical protein